MVGWLEKSGDAAAKALSLARRAGNKWGQHKSSARQGQVAHLRGQVSRASEAFRQAEELAQKTGSGQPHLYSAVGIWHADFLRRTGAFAYARLVTEANLEICKRYRWPNDTSSCLRVLGELDAADGRDESARTHFDTALTMARGISDRPALIEALLARGRWAARGAVPDPPQALSHLREALGYATDGGYRIYEADIRNALAWAYLADGDPDAARASATRARAMSEEMGYHWGLVDADEVLKPQSRRRGTQRKAVTQRFFGSFGYQGGRVIFLEDFRGRQAKHADLPGRFCGNLLNF